MNNYLCVCLINAVWTWYWTHSPFHPITMSESTTYYWRQINIEINYTITFFNAGNYQMCWGDVWGEWGIVCRIHKPKSKRFSQIMVFFLKWHITGTEELNNKWNYFDNEAITSGWAVFHDLKCTAIEVSISYYCTTNNAAFTHLDKAVIDANQWLQCNTLSPAFRIYIEPFMLTGTSPYAEKSIC